MLDRSHAAPVELWIAAGLAKRCRIVTSDAAETLAFPDFG